MPIIFHMNGHIAGFHPQIKQKSEKHPVPKAKSTQQYLHSIAQNDRGDSYSCIFTGKNDMQLESLTCLPFPLDLER